MNKIQNYLIHEFSHYRNILKPITKLKTIRDDLYGALL